MMFNYDGGGSWLWMGSMMLLFWGGVILLAIWIIHTMTSSRHAGDSAIETLRRRMAAGEISAEEFERTRKALG